MNINRHRRSAGRYAKRTHKLRNVVIGVVMSVATLGVIGACSDTPPDMSQDTFPCNEDEVLGYAPEFGPDNVGCIHIEDVK